MCFLLKLSVRSYTIKRKNLIFSQLADRVPEALIDGRPSNVAKIRLLHQQKPSQIFPADTEARFFLSRRLHVRVRAVG